MAHAECLSSGLPERPRADARESFGWEQGFASQGAGQAYSRFGGLVNTAGEAGMSVSLSSGHLDATWHVGFTSIDYLGLKNPATFASVLGTEHGSYRGTDFSITTETRIATTEPLLHFAGESAVTPKEAVGAVGFIAVAYWVVKGVSCLTIPVTGGVTTPACVFA